MSMIFIFFFNDTATTEIYTLSLHDALPISIRLLESVWRERPALEVAKGLGLAYLELEELPGAGEVLDLDRKSTRLNSSHTVISYAVFCLKKKHKVEVQHLIDRWSHGPLGGI